MSRIEKKFIIDNKNELVFYKWLERKIKLNLYPDRKILNIYYDNNKLQSYNDSIEGVRPRKKIRVRLYNNFSDQFKKLSDFDGLNCNIEKKVTDFYKNYKNKRKIVFNHLFPNHYDKQYGFLSPKYITEYKRSYFLLNECRITLDNQLNFYKINNDLNINEKIVKNFKILEFELPSESFGSSLNKFVIPPSRYSKYLDAVNSFKKDKFREDLLVS